MEAYYETKLGDYIYLTTVKVPNARTRIKVYNFLTKKVKYIYSSSFLSAIAKDINKIEDEIAKMFGTDSTQTLIEELKTIYK